MRFYLIEICAPASVAAGVGEPVRPGSSCPPVWTSPAIQCVLVLVGMHPGRTFLFPSCDYLLAPSPFPSISLSSLSRYALLELKFCAEDLTEIPKPSRAYQPPTERALEYMDIPGLADSRCLNAGTGPARPGSSEPHQRASVAASVNLLLWSISA